MIIIRLIYPKKNLQWDLQILLKKSDQANTQCHVSDWTKNSASCPANARHKNSGSIAHPFICYSDLVTLYEHNLESTHNSR